MKRFYALFILIPALVPVSDSLYPEDYSHIQRVELDSSFSFTCIGEKSMLLIYPQEVPSYGVYPSKLIYTQTKLKNGLFKHQLYRSVVVVDDTGFYGCVNSSTTDSVGLLMSKRNYLEAIRLSERLIYMYVYTDPPEFIEETNPGKLLANEGSDLEIPCRLNNLYSEVHLVRPDAQKNYTFNEAKYFPKNGFILYNVQRNDEGIVMCKVPNSESTKPVVYNISVYSLLKPKLIVERDDISENSDVKINCTFTYLENTIKNVVWQLTHGSAINPDKTSMKMFKFRCKEEDGTKIIKETNELTIYNFTSKDEGHYHCLIQSDQYFSVNSAATFINIFDPKEAFIDIIVPYDPALYYRYPRESVIFVAKYTHRPRKIHLKWFDNNGTEIIPSNTDSRREYSKHCIKKSSTVKYVIRRVKNEARLLIRDLKISDSGTYTLKASNKYGIKKSHTFKLIVREHFSTFEVMRISRGKSMRNNILEVLWNINHCYFHTSCVFEGYPLYPSKDAKISTNVQIYEGDDSAAMCPVPLKILHIPTEEYGTMVCTSKNKLIGVIEHTETGLLNADIEDEFIVHSTGDYQQHSEVTVSCSALIKKFKSIEWRYKGGFLNGAPLRTNDEKFRGKVTNFTTDTTRWTKLKFPDIQFSDTMNVTCEAITLNNTVLYKDIDIIVTKRITPLIIKTNMGPSTASPYFSVQLEDTFTMYGTVVGDPKPAINWYKDNQEIFSDHMYTISEDPSMLTITGFTANHTGTYKCRASNIYGQVEITLKLFVFQPEYLYVIIGVSMPIGVTILGLISIALWELYRTKLKKIILDKTWLKILSTLDYGKPEDIKEELPISKQAYLFPYKSMWEFVPEKVDLLSQISSGMFGKVLNATAELGNSGKKNPVTVHRLDSSSVSQLCIYSLCNELKLLSEIGSNLNIVNLIGAVTSRVNDFELYVILEHCPYGNLQSYLIQNKQFFNDLVNFQTDTIGNYPFARASDVPEKRFIQTKQTNMEYYHQRSHYWSDYNNNLNEINTKDLLYWSFQIASGMRYLSDMDVVHGDLCLSNVLLTDDNVVKICDIGSLCNSSFEKKNRNLLYRWRPAEVMIKENATVHSDVWSFGIVLWELFTLGETPYSDLGGENIKEITEMLVKGYRLRKPKYCTGKIYKLMMDCWTNEPLDRPTFLNIVSYLSSFLDDSTLMAHSRLERIRPRYPVRGLEPPPRSILKEARVEEFEIVETEQNRPCTRKVAFANIDAVEIDIEEEMADTSL